MDPDPPQDWLGVTVLTAVLSVRRLKEEDLTKWRHRLKKRSTCLNLEAARRLWKSAPATSHEDQPINGMRTNGRVNGFGDSYSAINGHNGLVFGAATNGAANGRIRQLESSSERMVAGVCRSEEGRVKVFLKVASQEEEEQLLS